MDLIEAPDSPLYPAQVALAQLEDTLEKTKAPFCEIFTADVRALLDIVEVAFGILRHGEYCSCEEDLLQQYFAALVQTVLPI
jgi:hypothetical protein